MSNKNINSFAQNVNKVVEQGTNTISLLGAMQQSMTTNDTFVTYDYKKDDGETIRYQLPSYDSIVNRVHSIEKSIESIVSGKGIVNIEDGTTRTVKVTTLPIAPNQITGLMDPSTFDIDSNWFFEQLMFPGATVEIDLTDKIDDTADRVRISRIILNSNDTAAETIWMNDLSNNMYDYASLKTLLTQNNVAYYEDEQTVELPLVKNRVSGTFQVSEDPKIIDGNLWYVLDNLNYSTIDDNGVEQGKNNILSKGDKLNYADSLFEVIEINQNNNLVRLKKTHGVATPGIYTVFSYYEDPYRSKTVNIRFGAHEYNIVYIKAIAEESNLLSDQWSTPVRFASDELVLNGTSGQTTVEFINYYNQYIMDWGANMIAEAKEHKIAAWYGKTPNAPTLNGDDFRVVQINTQINAAIDTTDVKNTASEIESTKSQIASLKQTIAAQKTDLQSASDTYTYTSIQQQIATNTVELNNLQVTYSTLVDSFQTLVRENSAILAEPKYHIRGFFPIPPLRYYDDNETVAEQIIGFDIAYRYIKEDNTATQLNTFTYTDADGVSKITGTFTDWIVEQGHMRDKVYDENMLRYVWRSENIADGTETNINQIDIAINKGEKVEFMVRSISEAGYPENPLKSTWSNTVIIEFPSTLSTTNEIADLITMVNDDALQITINNTLDSIGVSVHLDDTVANTNSVVGTYYKHLSKNIAYEEKKIENGITTINTINLQDKLDEILRSLNYATSLNEKQASDISTLDAIQKVQHKYYDASLNQIFGKFDEHMNDSSIELASKVDIGEYTEIQNKLVLNASADIYDTQIVLLSNNNRDLILEVFKRDENKTEEVYIPIKVSDVYIDSSVNKYSINDILANNESSLTSLESWKQIVNASVNIAELELTKVAYDSSLKDVSNNLTRLRNDFDAIVKDSEVYSGGGVILNKNKVKLSGGDGNGILHVYNGQAQNLYTDVKARNLILYPSGNEDSGLIDLTVLYDEYTDTQTKVEKIEENLTNIQENYIEPVISVEGTTFVVTANKVSADINIETPQYKIMTHNNNEFHNITATGGEINMKYSSGATTDDSKLIVKDVLFRHIVPTISINEPILLNSWYDEYVSMKQKVEGIVNSSTNVDADGNETIQTTISSLNIIENLFFNNLIQVSIDKANRLNINSTIYANNVVTTLGEMNSLIKSIQSDINGLQELISSINGQINSILSEIAKLKGNSSTGGTTPSA